MKRRYRSAWFSRIAINVTIVLVTVGVTSLTGVGGAAADAATGSGSTPVPPAPTVLTYSGPTSGDDYDQFFAAATLTSAGNAVSGAAVDFTLGPVGGTATCTATTDNWGVADCMLTPYQVPGANQLTAAFQGDSVLASNTDTVRFSITREETATSLIEWGTDTRVGSGPIANGVVAGLTGEVESDDMVPPNPLETLNFTMGSGSSQQSCGSGTNRAGIASCVIPVVNQPLDGAATVPVTVAFAGDAFLRPATITTLVPLEYYTGRAFGLSAGVHLAPPHLTVAPTPSTGQVRVAQAQTTTTPCLASLDTSVVTAHALCANVTTTLAPGTVSATSTVGDAVVRLPGEPVLDVSGLTATSTSTCGSAAGSVVLTLRVNGDVVNVSTAPNTVIPFDGGSLIVNEQLPVVGADFGLTVNALHIELAGGGGDIVLGSATSAVHDCGSSS